MIDRMGICAIFAGMPEERAENAVDVADVRVIRVRVYHEGDVWSRIFSEPDFACQFTQFQEFGIPDDEETLFGEDTFVLLYFPI
jgi:hypothetical protein